MQLWAPARIWTGSNRQKCVKCGDRIIRGEWSKVEKVSGRVYHDCCAEDLGAYGIT